MTVTNICEVDAYERHGWGAGPLDSSLRTWFKRSTQTRAWDVAASSLEGELLERHICYSIELVSDDSLIGQLAAAYLQSIAGSLKGRQPLDGAACSRGFGSSAGTANEPRPL